MSTKSAARVAPAHEDDCYAWTMDQAEKLRGRRHDEIVWAKFQPEKRKGGWQASISGHRHRIALTLDGSPGLADCPGAVLDATYDTARSEALMATQLPAGLIPVVCPHSIEQVVDSGFPDGLYQDVSQ